MKILGKSRGLAAILAVAVGLVAVPASAQMAPTGSNPAAPQTPAKPAAPAAPAAPAKPADPNALLQSADKKLKANDYAGALADYEASNTAKASPKADIGIARSHDKLGHFAEAVVAYDRLVAAAPKDMKAEVDEAKKRSDEIKAMPGKVHLETTPAGAQIIVDPKGDQDAPLPQTTPTDLDLPAGKHKIKVQAEGYEPTEKEIDVTFASKQDVKVELTKKPEAAPVPPPPVTAEPTTPAPAPPPPPPAEPRSRLPAYVTGGVAVLALGIGTGFGIKALSQSSDFDKTPTTKIADDGENNALIADMMFGIAITFGVTSAVLFLSNDAPQTAKATPAQPKPVAKKITVTPTPYVTPSGGGAGAVIKF
ncbi:MAG: PEGA domain-containing protein [Deltaproteobacteria bacterium]|nr:PEGA domain-containing protein [Deltaproteobacteria bacterium]